MTIATTEELHPALAAALPALDTEERRTEWQQHEIKRTAWMRHPDTTPEEIEAEWQRARAGVAEMSAGRFARWLGRVPARFRGAHLGELKEPQCPEELARWLADPEALTLFIVGAPGRGKTHAAYAIANAVAAQGAVFAHPLPHAWSVPGLLDALRPSAKDAEGTWGLVKNTPLLVLDDLANVRPTDWAIERVWMLADARTGDNLRTVITTNASWADLEATWGTPTMDRFRDRSAVVKFAGENHRRPAW